MIIYGLLKVILYILGLLASVLGSLIPSFPDSITALFSSISSIYSGGMTFISYFFEWSIILLISYHGFKVVKDAIMKVVGHFIGN